MKPFFSKFAAVALAVSAMFAMASCSQKKFRVNGQIGEAQDSVLYFENMSLDGPVVVDSVKLGGDGDFSFSVKAAKAPEFYRLRIAGQIVNLSADSTETVTVKANYPTMATQYAVDGSENCKKIKELALKQIALQYAAQQVAKAPGLGLEAVRDSIYALIGQYKEDVTRNYIFREPMKAYSYFALFQYIVVGNQYVSIFDPRRDAADNKVFAAVATSWDAFYPGSVRGENLHNIAIEGMKNQRIVDQRNSMVIDADKLDTSNIIDIALVDNKGKEQRLTDLKGKVVMLDFHVFAQDQSTERIMMMRELWNKFHGQGFEIFQVSLDPDAHFWKTKTEALPWVSVRDDEGLNSTYLMKYNVQSIPTFFLVDRDGMLQKRDVQIKNLEQEIQSML